MLQVDKRPFIVIGACEAVSQVFSMIGAAHLPGVHRLIMSGPASSHLICSSYLAGHAKYNIVTAGPDSMLMFG